MAQIVGLPGTGPVGMVETIWVTLGRSLLLAAWATLLASALYPHLRNEKRRGWWLAAILTPWITPPLLPAYVYSAFHGVNALRPVLAEGLYGMLTISRILAASVLPFLLLTRDGGEAVHSLRLRLAKAAPTQRAFRLGWGYLMIHRSAVFASLLLGFWISLDEFEIASFLGPHHLTAMVFDQHAGGTALIKTLGWAALLALLHLLPMAGVIHWFLQAKKEPPTEEGKHHIHPPPSAWPVWILAALLCLHTLYPLVRILPDAWGYVGLQWSKSRTEWVSSLVFALSSSALAIGLAMGAVGKIRLALMALGSCGALPLSLLLLRLAQSPALRFLYDSPFWCWLGLAILLFPLALAIQLVLHAWERQASIFSGALLIAGSPTQERTGRRILRQVRTRGVIITFCLIFPTAFSTLTLPYILAPASLRPLAAWLFNFMHYGNSGALSALMLISVLTPGMLIIGGIQMLKRIPA